MIDTKQFLSAINQIAEEKGIPKEKIIETIEIAIAAAYKKDYGEKGQVIRSKLDSETGEMKIFQVKTVMDKSLIKSEEDIEKEELMSDEQRAELIEKERKKIEEDENYIRKVRFNEDRHIMLKDAKEIKKGVKVGDELVFSLEAHDDFGRIAAQTAKQVIVQRLREVEREVALEEYKEKEGEIVGVQVQRLEGKNVVVDLGKTMGIMYPEDQIAGENYRIGERLRVYVVKVEASSKGPVILVSRSHPKIVAKLFELEIPEVASGVVEIKSLTREAGARTKIAVWTDQEGIDPIGSCVGQKGTRIDTIISELNREKIDIIEWSEDPAEFISNALSPAKVLNVDVNEETKEASVIVPEDQLSLAIGKGGQNVRLAAKLTGWKIDVKSAGGEETKEESIDEEITDKDIKENQEVEEDVQDNSEEETKEEK
jgi:N utilization substance protein A